MVSKRALFKEVKPGVHYGPGSVIIIPAVTGCNCEHRCVAMDEFRTAVKCICPSGQHLAQDGMTCVCKYTILPYSSQYPKLGRTYTFVML